MAERWLDRVSRSEFKGIQNQNASFKGVGFILKNSETTIGRRLIPHEYPQKDIPFTEDMGRKVRIFKIQGRILGPNYLTGRDNLFFVSEESGPGELIHPFYGSLQVLLEELKFNDDTANTRKVDFTATFFETGELTFPIESPDTPAAVATQVDINLNDLKSPFERAYDVLSRPLVFSSGLLQSLNQAYDAIDKAKQIVNIGPEFSRDLNSFKIQAAGIITSGSSVFDSIVNLITFGLLDNENRNDSLDQTESFLGLIPLLEHESDVSIPSTSSQEIDKLVQQAAVITMALNSSKINFTSANEAREFRNTILNKLDAILLDGVPDQVSQNYANLRAVVVQDIDTRSINLPLLKTIQPIQTTPSLVLSQDLYGDSSRAQDIVNRNNIEHPGFIPGGKDLEVLLDVE